MKLFKLSRWLNVKHQIHITHFCRFELNYQLISRHSMHQLKNFKIDNSRNNCCFCVFVVYLLAPTDSGRHWVNPRHTGVRRQGRCRDKGMCWWGRTQPVTVCSLLSMSDSVVSTDWNHSRAMCHVPGTCHSGTLHRHVASLRQLGWPKF